jgi:hypothetical protein
MVTIPPVYVEGDAGAQQLIKGADSARGQRSCTTEILNATLDCATAGATALGAVAASTTVIGGVAGFALTTTMSAYCGRALRAVHDCEQ